MESSGDENELKRRVAAYQKDFQKIREEFSKMVVGQDDTINKLLMAMMARGHVLIEGFPGIAKTLIVKTVAKITGCQFSRIQFTPDLLPSDITGVYTYDEVKKFYIVKGPIFANFVLADEINRASPKVQSALLEAMQERQTTIGKETYALPNPFFVIATQNPIESVGVYNLPEAQVDRFLYKLKMTYPKKEDEEKVLEINMTVRDFDHYKINPVISKEKILLIQKDIIRVHMDSKLKSYIVSIVDSTRNPSQYGIEMGKFIDIGASPRASIGLYIAAKSHALMANKTFTTPHDVKEIAYDVLRHRITLNYEAQAESVKSEDIIQEILKKVPIP
ncbi:MAG TPA: MoxR family ATPase [Candidatus Nanoarchaeia archaeon]|nr:MoxR family ATPase [Candidatus Nanoarchaeia archaeon]